MTIVISWLSKEREFPTVWTVCDSRLSNNFPDHSPLFDCGAKLFSLRVFCSERNENGELNQYFSTTIGMAFAGSSLLALNLNAFLSYTLGNLVVCKDHTLPSLKNISEHVKAIFELMLKNYIDINFQSISCEISVFGFCPINKEHQLFHIKHNAKDRNVDFKEFLFNSDDSIHIMGNHQEEIFKLVASTRNGSSGRKFWRAPKVTVENVICEKIYDDIGGEMQLGISYPRGFKLTPIYVPPNLLEKCLFGESKSKLMYQGINLYSNSLLHRIGECFIETDSIVQGE